MHILHIIDTLGLGGAERMLVDLANATVADGHKVSVCITHGDLTLAPELASEVSVFALGRRPRRGVRAALRLATWLRQHDVDVVHVHMRHTLAFVLCLRVARLARAPIVFHDHYGGIEADASVPRWFPIGTRFIDYYVGVYERLTQWAIEAGMPAARAVTIPNALDLRRFGSTSPARLRDELRVPPTLMLGVVVATVRSDKDIEMLIEAVALSAVREKIHIAVAGSLADEAYVQRCRALIRTHSLERVITLLGPRTDVPALLPAADFALLSSRTESGPLVLVEYLAAAVPIVATAVGDIGRRMAGLGVEGFVPPSDARAFARAMDDVVQLSGVDRKARGERGRRVLEERWDIKSAMPSWYELYDKAAKPHAL